MRFLRLVFIAFLPLLSVCAPAQSRSATPQPPSSTTRPESIQDSGIYGYWTHMTDQGRADGALLGKLTVEGEPMLWEPVPISVMCNGKAVHTTLTDPKGRFVIRTTAAGGLTLQNDIKRQMETYFEGCTVEAALAGFDANTITITQRNLRDDPELGTITLHREASAIGTAISTTGASAPTSPTSRMCGTCPSRFMATSSLAAPSTDGSSLVTPLTRVVRRCNRT